MKSSKKDEKAWNLILRQNGADISGAILRIDGDTGTLTGRYQDGKFILSHFSGARANLPRLSIAEERWHSIRVGLIGQPARGAITGVRPWTKPAPKAFRWPTNPTEHTGVKDGLAAVSIPLSRPER